MGSRRSDEKLSFYLVRQNDGSLEICYKALKPGLHAISITHDGQNISGSPFYCHVQKPAEKSYSTVYGLDKKVVTDAILSESEYQSRQNKNPVERKVSAKIHGGSRSSKCLNNIVEKLLLSNSQDKRSFAAKRTEEINAGEKVAEDYVSLKSHDENCVEPPADIDSQTDHERQTQEAVNLNESFHLGQTGLKIPLVICRDKYPESEAYEPDHADSCDTTMEWSNSDHPDTHEPCNTEKEAEQDNAKTFTETAEIVDTVVKEKQKSEDNTEEKAIEKDTSSIIDEEMKPKLDETATKKKKRKRKKKKKDSERKSTKGRAVAYIYPHSHDAQDDKKLLCVEPHCTRKYKTRVRLEIHKLVHEYLRSLGGPFEDGNLRSLSFMLVCNKETTETQFGQAHDAMTGSWYKCPDVVCEKSFRTVSHLEKHLIRHCTPLYKCTELDCRKRFHMKKTLVSHMTKHHQESHICSICGSSYRSSKHLKAHMRYHTDNSRQFVCSVPGCNSRFNLNRYLQQHMHTHKTTFDFLCQICGKAFKRSECLRAHLLSKAHTKLEQILIQAE